MTTLKSRQPRWRHGFTIIELMVVISIMAIIATLAIGAAGKSLQQMRDKRISAMARALEVALMNYRAQENRWPFAPQADMRPDRKKEVNLRWACRKQNQNVFRQLYPGAGNASRAVSLDATAFLTEVGGSRLSLAKALEKGLDDAPLGYPLPRNTSTFNFFCVQYNPVTDAVKVVRQGEGHECTN